MKAIVLDQGEAHSILRRGDCEGIFFAFIVGDVAMEKYVQCYLDQYVKCLKKWKKDPTVSSEFQIVGHLFNCLFNSLAFDFNIFSLLFFKK